MLDSIISGISGTTSLTVAEFLFCTAASLILGILAALLYMYKNAVSKSFAITLALLPAMVQIVIMLVNGNLGTGIAVMGAFGLVRFRSVPGSAREIASIFLAMAIGLAAGMGYIAIAAMFLVIIAAVNLILIRVGFGTAKREDKELKITIPETLDYTGLFDDLFEKYTTGAVQYEVRTTNMGSLYELRYHITMKDLSKEKEFLDEIRVRNGNLNIICGRVSTARQEL